MIEPIVRTAFNLAQKNDSAKDVANGLSERGV